jgi:hypothetical protein
MSTRNPDSTFAAVKRAAAPSSSARPLRAALLLDAAVTGVNGLAYLAASRWLGDLLGVPPLLLQCLGAFLVLFGVFVFAVAGPSSVSRAAARVVIGANVIWAVGSVVTLLTGALMPTAIGIAWIVLQAAAVAGLAALQAHALR